MVYVFINSKNGDIWIKIIYLIYLLDKLRVSSNDSFLRWFRE